MTADTDYPSRVELPFQTTRITNPREVAMSRIRIMLLATGLSVAAILLASATRAPAPGGPGGPGGSGGGPRPGEGWSLSLVVTPAVQDELELTKNQKTEIDTLKSEVAKKSRAI